MFHFNKSSCAAIALLASTALAPAAFAQGANQPVQDCPGLQGYLDQNRATLSEDQIRQADEAVLGGQAEACVLISTQFNQGGGQQAQGQQPGQAPAEAGAANIVVQQPAPTITVDQAQPQISVQQAQPNVTVRQPQPEIIVRQPAPVVTIDIPQPEIIVRMPQPEVMVQQTPPQVQVQQAQPQVRVEQPEQPQVQVTESQQPQVQLTQPEGQANVQVEQTGEAKVTYERAEPQVNINQAEGQPTITVEQMQPDQAGQQPPAGDQAARAAATQQLRDSEDPNRTPESQESAAAGQQPAAGQQQAAAQGQATAQPQAGAQGQMQTVTLDDFEGMQVVNARGEQMGEVENLVMSTTDNKQYVVISHGGFLGLGEKRVALSLEGLTMQGDRIVVPGLTDEQIRALPEFQANEQAFPDVEDGAQLQIMSAQQ